MKYCSIDIETTGLDPNTCNIIEFAAIIDDFRELKPIDCLPAFQVYILHEKYIGDPYALSLHSEIFKKLSDWRKDSDIKVCRPNDLFRNFNTFLTTHGYKPVDGKIKINVAGKNFSSFDRRFLDKLPNGCIEFHHRSLDPAILYFNPILDETLPSTEECMRRAGMNPVVAHTALADAKVVVELLRKKLITKSFDFTIVLEGHSNLDEESDIFSKVYDAGCSDGLVGCVNGVVFVDFTREAASYEEAVQGAIKDLKNAGFTPKAS